MVLQWATYRDASDQTSLSRIWGGIHPPADDLPGRLIGLEIGKDAFELASQYFNGGPTGIFDRRPARENIVARVYPNPASADQQITVEIDQPDTEVVFELMNLQGRRLQMQKISAAQLRAGFQLTPDKDLPAGTYLLRVSSRSWETTQQIVLE